MIEKDLGKQPKTPAEVVFDALNNAPRTLDCETFSQLSEEEQQLLIYFARTTFPYSDVSLSELELVGLENVDTVITKLKESGFIQEGINPHIELMDPEDNSSASIRLRQEVLARSKQDPEFNKDRFYLEPDLHQFIGKVLPQMWWEQGLLED